MNAEGQFDRGEICLVDFGADPADPEQVFIRPAVIVSDNRLHHPNLGIVIVVPGTSTIRGKPLHVALTPDTGNGHRLRRARTRRLCQGVEWGDRHDIGSTSRQAS